jgi:outer membrane receptor protein involved in Fe transport
MRRITTTIATLLTVSAAMPAAADDDELNLNALLQTDLTVVSATKTKQTIAESPAVVDVITSDDLAKRGYRTVAEAVTSLPGLYGVDDWAFTDIGVRGVTGEMRGRSRLLKVMIDGRPVSFRADTANFVGPEMIPISAVDHIEVIRGPGSALYGANAFLGVINVVTKRASSLNGTTVRLTGEVPQVGGFGGGVEAVGGGSLGPLDIMIAGSAARFDRSGQKLPCGSVYPDADDPCAEQSAKVEAGLFDRVSTEDISQPRSLVATVDLDVARIFKEDSGRFGNFRLLANYQEIDTAAPYADWGVLSYSQAVDGNGDPAGVAPNTGNRIGLANTTVSTNYTLGLFEDQVSLGVTAGYARGGATGNDRMRDQNLTDSAGLTKQRAQYGFQGLDLAVDARLTLIEGLFAFGGGGASVIDDVTLIVSADHSRDDVSYAENAFAQPVGYITSTLENTGALGQLTGNFLGRRLGFVAGARYDTYLGAQLTDVQLDRVTDPETLCDGRVCYSSFNYRAGLTGSPLKSIGSFVGGGAIIDILYLKALYGTAYKAPDPTSLYHDDYIGAFPLRPNVDLVPQTVTSIEGVLGIEMLGKRIQGQFVVFDNEIENLVAYQPVSGGVQARNAARAQTIGVEAQVKGRLEGIGELGVNASQQTSTRLFDSEFATNIPTTFAYPDLMAGGWITADLGWSPVIVTAKARYIGSRVGSPLNGRDDNEDSIYRLDPYLLMDAFVTTRPLKIFDASHDTTIAFNVSNILNTSYVVPGFQPASGTDLPGRPRVFQVTVSQSF